MSVMPNAPPMPKRPRSRVTVLSDDPARNAGIVNIEQCVTRVLGAGLPDLRVVRGRRSLAPRRRGADLVIAGRGTLRISRS